MRHKLLISRAATWHATPRMCVLHGVRTLNRLEQQSNISYTYELDPLLYVLFRSTGVQKRTIPSLHFPFFQVPIDDIEDRINLMLTAKKELNIGGSSFELGHNQ